MLNKKLNKIYKDIINGDCNYFGHGHFHSSNMADYTLMSCTIEDMASCYNINETEAVDLIQALTHN